MRLEETKRHRHHPELQHLERYLMNVLQTVSRTDGIAPYHAGVEQKNRD
ncbi:hypothetical protein PO124_10495 [Bacillus licheniformis]|nr:hypothetical protein [Bacillus licheniformis]